jgi:metal-responsive CopG/Arc/MetJ family transcriptional regulator
MSTLNNTKKKMGRPSVDSEALTVRMDRPLLDRVDEFAEGQGHKGRPAAVRALVRHALDAYRSTK